MEHAERERLRRLAVWLACRRETEEIVSQLTWYGPSASHQVAIHLAGLRVLLAAEADAFGAVEAASEDVVQRDLPTVVTGGVTRAPAGTVHSLDLARDRHEQA